MDRRTFLNQASTLGAGLSLFGIAQHAIAVDPPNIVLGMSLPFTGVASINAQQFREGARILFESVNASGGIHGRRIQLLILDDKFDKELVVQNARKLVDQGALALFGFMGTPGIIEVSKFVNENKIPLVGAVSGAPIVKDPSNRYVFVVRSSFAHEASSAVEIGTTTGVRSWGVVYQDDGQGRAALGGVTASLARQKLAPLVEAPFPPSAKPDFTQALLSIEKQRPAALIFGGSAPALAAFVTQAKEKGIILPVTTVLSVVSPEMAISLLGDDAIGLRFTQPVPYPYSTRNVGSSEYVGLVKRFSKEPASFLGMEGFLSAKLMIKTLQLTPSLRREKLVSTLESMTNFPLTEDFRVTYGPGNRSGSSFVDTMIIGRQRNILR